MDTIQSVRVAARGLRRNPAFAATAILTLALGIGLSTAVFTVAESLLLRELPVRDQDRLIVLWGQTPDRRFANYPLPLADARAFGRESRSIEGAAFFSYAGAWPTAVHDADIVSRLRLAHVSGEFFDVLGVHPALGRALRAADDAAGAAPVVVLSHGAWQRLYGKNPDVLGRRIVMHATGIAHEVVGVMPPGLDYPRGADVWAPLVPARTEPGAAPPVIHVDIVARLRPGADASTARDELTAFFGRSEASLSQRNMRGVVNALPALILGDARPAVIAFSAASALLLLIACMNVANLLLVRGVARLGEITVRFALGASRPRLIALLLVEDALLALASGLLGVVLAIAAVRGFMRFAPATLPRIDEIQINGTALGAALTFTTIALLLFSIVPAVIGSRVRLQRVLRAGNRHVDTRRSRRAADAFVAGQVALAVVVLSAAGLIARSLINLERVELAFEREHLLIGELAVRSHRVDSREKQLALLDSLLPAMRGVPGVRAVSPVVAVPFSGSGGWDGRSASEGQSADEMSRNPILNIEIVEPGYFAALGIAAERGRLFTDKDRDGALPVVIVSQSTARHYWPDQDPVGKRLLMGQEREHRFTVVGVVPDTRYRELRQARPSIYFPLRQSVFPFAPVTLAIRTDGLPASVVPALRHAISAVEPDVVLATATPFDSFLDAPMAQPRLNALLLAVFAIAAIALAGIGLFGVVTAMVRQRTFEIGVRMALGARAADVRRMVVRRGLAIAAVGIGMGLVGALWANHLLAAMLYEVTPSDVTTLLGAVSLLLGVAAVAAGIPAFTGSRIDPATALRDEG